jgi:hypothetical protein
MRPFVSPVMRASPRVLRSSVPQILGASSSSACLRLPEVSLVSDHLFGCPNRLSRPILAASDSSLFSGTWDLWARPPPKRRPYFGWVSRGGVSRSLTDHSSPTPRRPRLKNKQHRPGILPTDERMEPSTARRSLFSNRSDAASGCPAVRTFRLCATGRLSIYLETHDCWLRWR